MKKILLSLTGICITVLVLAQNIDTVLVRNLQWQAQDWGWIIGKYKDRINNDSASAALFRYIRNEIRAANPQTRTVNITVDSLPGRVVLDFYRTIKTANAGEIALRYTSMTNAISSKANMTFFTNQFDNVMSNDFEKSFLIGKFIIIDQ